MMPSDDADRLGLLERALPECGGILTIADTATIAGVGVDAARALLGRLIDLYPAEAGIDRNGNVRVRFTLPLLPRGAYSFSERLTRLRHHSRRWFIWLDRAFIAVVATVYVGWAFILVRAVAMKMMKMTIGLIASLSDDRRPPPVIPSFAPFLSGWRELLSSRDSHAIDDDLSVRKPRQSAYPPKKKLLHAITDFILGEYRPPRRAFGARDIASFLRDNGGILSTTDIVLMCGCSFEEAEQKLAEAALELGGDISIVEDGMVVGEFTSFVQTFATRIERVHYEWWDRYEPPYRHSGNHPAQKLSAALFLAFAGFFNTIPFALVEMLYRWISAGTIEIVTLVGSILITTQVAVGWFMLLYSLTRLVGVHKNERARQKRLFLRNLLRSIADSYNHTLTDEKIASALPPDFDRYVGSDEKWDLFDQALSRWQGAAQVDDQGNVYYAFTRIGREIVGSPGTELEFAL